MAKIGGKKENERTKNRKTYNSDAIREDFKMHRKLLSSRPHSNVHRPLAMENFENFSFWQQSAMMI